MSDKAIEVVGAAPERASREELRQGCECSCCDHGEGSDCACACHATGKCSAERASHPEPLSLHRCKICGTRWLLWPAGVGGTKDASWNMLDKYQRPTSCCDNAPMGEQIEHLRDLPLDAARTPQPAAPAHPPAVARRFAEAVTRDLFTNGQGQRAERLVLWAGRDLGGWGEAVVVDRITEAIEAALRAAGSAPK